MKKKYLIALLAFSSMLMSDGASIYASKCASCHGAHGEKSALGKSKVIAGQDAATTTKQIQGYKSGTLNMYGMGGAMKNMVKGLDDASIKEVANYISKL
ncbi:MAG: c-type cytochrome [Sulfurospirillaceae bacterium]|nr:c-type cytochrome [Sulfurospirillaceae bacterium]